MKNLKLYVLSLLTLLIFAISANAQQGVKSKRFTIAGPDSAINLVNTAIAWHKLTWNVSGTASACTVALDTSTNGTTWTAGGAITGQTCTSNGSSSVVNVSANYVRMNMTALTVTAGSSVTVTWDGFTSNPSGGGSVVISANQVAYGSGTNAIGGSNLFTWNPATPAWTLLNTSPCALTPIDLFTICTEYSATTASMELIGSDTQTPGLGEANFNITPAHGAGNVGTARATAMDLFEVDSGGGGVGFGLAGGQSGGFIWQGTEAGSTPGEVEAGTNDLVPGHTGTEFRFIPDGGAILQLSTGNETWDLNGNPTLTNGAGSESLTLVPSTGTGRQTVITADATAGTFGISPAVTNSGALTLGPNGLAVTGPVAAANQVVAGTDGVQSGALITSNGAVGGGHTIWGSAATTTNTIDGFTVVPTTGDIVTVTSSGSTATLTDSGTTVALLSAPTLNSLAAASTSHTIANGNNPQTWNWAQTSNTQSGITFGEIAAATGGTLTGVLANQSEMSISTASNSTATPFSIVQGSQTGTTAPPAFQVQTTWNNASLTGEGLLINVTNTSSSATSKPLDVRVGGSTVFEVFPGGSFQSNGGSCAGTCSMGTAAQTSFNTTGLVTKYNNITVAGQGIAATPAAPAVVVTGTGTSIGSTSLCATANCPAGTYKINAYMDVTTACTTGGTYFASVTYTDDQGSKTIVMPLSGTGTTLTLGPTAFTDSMAFASTANFAQGNLVVRSTGAAAINYTTTAGACATGGPGVGNLYWSVVRLQ